MRQNNKVEKSSTSYNDAARMAFFQLAAAATNFFLLWPSQNSSTAKKVGSVICMTALHGVAYGAANYFKKPTVQPKSEKVEPTSSTKNDSKGEETTAATQTNEPAQPATPAP